MPEMKVKGRNPGTLTGVRKALPLCDQIQILDNSRYSDPFRQVATIRHFTYLANARMGSRRAG